MKSICIIFYVLALLLFVATIAIYIDKGNSWMISGGIFITGGIVSLGLGEIINQLEEIRKKLEEK
jgi:hypothetical protein